MIYKERNLGRLWGGGCVLSESDVGRRGQIIFKSILPQLWGTAGQGHHTSTRITMHSKQTGCEDLL